MHEDVPESPVKAMGSMPPQGGAEHVLRVAAMAEADRITIALGVDPFELMQRAGVAVAKAALAILAGMDATGDPAPESRDARVARVLCVCGAGNNGGDGYVAARWLGDHGVQVHVMAPLGPPVSVESRQAHVAWIAAGRTEPALHGRPLDVDAGLCCYDLIIDAMFGAGLNRALSGEALELVRRINRSGVPVLSVDVPSGLDADSGKIIATWPRSDLTPGDGDSVQATATVTFAALKPGHLLLPGRILCGELTCADIGIDAATIASVAEGLFRNTPELWLRQFPRPSLEAHKYKRGHVLCHSGGALSTGAIRLSARAALRIGAGLTTIAAGPEACRVHAAHLTAIMLREVDDAGAFARLLDDARFNAVILGPAGGVGSDLVARVAAAATRQRAIVIDADALSSFAGSPDLLVATVNPVAQQLTQDLGPESPGACEAAGLWSPTVAIHGSDSFQAAHFNQAGDQGLHLRKPGADVVLTPHDGEFSRVFGGVRAVAEATSKWRQAQLAAQLVGAVVVLKGADTVIAAPDGRVAINANAPPWLGTAGSGDVLAGFIGGLLAQGMPGFEAACAGVWIHGAAAARFGPGLIAEDLPDLAPAVLADILAMTGYRLK